MALIANGSMLIGTGVRRFGAAAYLSAYPSALHGGKCQAGLMRNITAGEGITSDLVSLPSGNRHPSAWMMPQKAGAVAARNTVGGTGGISASALAVKLAQAALTGSGDLTAFGSLIVQAFANLTGDGGITNAQVLAVLAALADLTGTGGISDAEATGIARVMADLLGIGGLDDSVITGIANASADIVVTGTGLTSANVGRAVWDAIAIANNTPGSMGEKLNDAGSAGNPWATVIESGFTAEEILRLIASAVAGKVSGSNANNPAFRDLGDTKDRITATTDDDGNRVSITYDPS